MPRNNYSDYSDVSWFVRMLRVVPVIAGAALLGGMIGGFAVFAIDSALTWEPAPQARPDARADNQSTSAEQTNKPVRVVGGAIPDPSAGMSGPPPAASPPQPQQRSAPPPAAAAQISSQLLTPKPLGPATQLQPQTATPAPAAAASPAQMQTANKPQTQAPVPTQTSTAPAQEPNRWPDALSRTHQNASTTQQQSTPPPVPAQPRETNITGATKNPETDRNSGGGNRAATADDQNRAAGSRHGRSRRQTFSANGFRNGGDDTSPARSSRQQDARSYDRLYDSYGNRGQRVYGNRNEPVYGDTRGDQDDGSYRSDARRYGRDARSRNRSRVITREQPDETDRTFEARQPRAEPFWGGGFFRGGGGYRDDD